MRNLTVKQKSLLKDWFNKNYDGGYMFDLVDKIDTDEYERIEKLNPCEVFYHNANNYLQELASNQTK